MPKPHKSGLFGLFGSKKRKKEESGDKRMDVEGKGRKIRKVMDIKKKGPLGGLRKRREKYKQAEDF